MTTTYDIEPETVIGTPGPDKERIVFYWHRQWGECHDCGLPAAFAADYYHSDGADEKPTDWEQLCCVCAANAATLGYRIKRLDEES